MATFVHYERPSARTVWAAIGVLHRALVPVLLVRAAKTLAGQPAPVAGRIRDAG